MRKKLISVCIVGGILLFGIYRYVKREDDIPEDYVQNEYIDAEETSEIETEATEEAPYPEAEPMQTMESAFEEEQKKGIDYTQDNIDKFYQIAEENYGLSHEETRSWFDTATADDVFKGGIRDIHDLIFDDIDSNGMPDMIIMVQEPEMELL